MKKVTKNAARCRTCDTVIESKHVHDFKSCPCGNLFVDGGLAYLRFGIRDGWDSMEDLSVTEEI